jgi:hypothetical protein
MASNTFIQRIVSSVDSKIEIPYLFRFILSTCLGACTSVQLYPAKKSVVDLTEDNVFTKVVKTPSSQKTIVMWKDVLSNPNASELSKDELWSILNQLISQLQSHDFETLSEGLHCLSMLRSVLSKSPCSEQAQILNTLDDFSKRIIDVVLILLTEIDDLSLPIPKRFTFFLFQAANHLSSASLQFNGIAISHSVTAFISAV